MAKEHLHELFYRNISDDGTRSISRFAAHRLPESETRDDLIRLCEGVAKDGKTLTERRDAIIYKVDGVCEFMVSRYFYLWPNTTDREERHGKNSGKGHRRQNESSSRRT